MMCDTNTENNAENNGAVETVSLTKEEYSRLCKMAGQRNSMAVYLRHSQACGCCLHQHQRPYKSFCPGCIGMDSKWEWGGWKGKPREGGNEVFANMDYCFEAAEALGIEFEA